MINIPLLALEDLSTLVALDRFQDTSGPMPDLDGDIVTLTLLPRSRWQTLLNLDVIQVSFYTFLFFLFLHTRTTRTNSKETSQKSLQRLQRRRPFFCLQLQALNHGWWFQTKKRRGNPRGNPKKLSQVQRACSFKNYRRSQKTAIVGVPFSL